MKALIESTMSVLIISALLFMALTSNYHELDAYNKASHSFQWVSHLGDDVNYVRRMGSSSQYYIGVSGENGDGIIDRNGKEILPCQYDAVDYNGGDYMAAATTSNWMLFDAKGKETASFNRISYPYAYAGDRYFIRYGDDHIEDVTDGFTIIDAVSGESVREYDDCYNAVRLDDGNWYISMTPDSDGIAARWILKQQPLYSGEHYDQDADVKEAPYGFFTDENFETLFHGKAYRLICQGDGLYIAQVIEKDAAQGDVMVLDESGEGFIIEDEDVLKRIGFYEKNADIVIDTTTVFKKEDGSIGFRSLKQNGKTLYLDEAGTRIEAENAETTEAAAYQEFSPPFSEVQLLPETNHILVNGSLGCGVIKWEVPGQ